MLVVLVVLSLISMAKGVEFVHPGVYLNADQLNYARQQITAQSGTHYDAYVKALNSSLAKPDYKPRGPPASGVIECGSYSHPDHGCSDESDDTATAFLQAMLFALNGNQTYADNAIGILNAYAYGVKKYNNTNAPLQSAWSAQMTTKAAELLKYNGARWQQEDQDQLAAFWKTLVLPLIVDGSTYNGNWELSMIDAMIGMAVFTNDTELFNHSVTFWRQRVPAYFYIHTDGDKPKQCPRGNEYWYNQTVFNASVDGVCQETCRDFGHMQFGLASTMYIAETAYIQGVDLYREEQARLTAALEFHAKYLLGAPVPDIICSGNGVKLSQSPTFEVAYNAYHHRNNVSLPLTWQHLKTQVRTKLDPEIRLIMVYEQLAHSCNQ
eukprot:m.144645 g.144645  ORF g.144645 m.144645 type:complete len:380 (-) comp16203_c0_seq2:1058-2197(-)